MLTSIATIAGAITALVGVYWSIDKVIKANKEKKRIAEGRSLEQQILEAGTDEERAKLSRILSDRISK